jgi:glycosyltransferase involved in cell wall biosynthesis
VIWNIRCHPDELRDDPSRTTLRRIVSVLERLSGQTAAIVVNSRASRQAHTTLGYHPPRWAYIPNGFDTEVLSPDSDDRARVRETLGLAPDADVIGLVARWDPVKDHATALRAMRALQAVRPAAHLLLVGPSPDHPGLEAAIAEHGLSGRVAPLGLRSDVPRLLRALDLAWLTSRSEGFPNVIGEAMATGVPVVSTDVGAAAEMIGDTGRVVGVGDHQAIAAASDELLGEPPPARATRALACRQTIIDRYDLPTAISAYEALYRDIAAGR